MKKYSGKVVVLLMILALIVGAAGSYAAVSFAQNRQAEPIVKADTSSAKGEAAKVKAIHDLIEKDYFKKVSSDKLYDGAIQGMIKALNDPFSSYMDAKTAKDFTQSLSSSFQGIGAEVQMVGNKVSIVSPIKGSPAEKAGLKPNDQILSINGKSTDGMNINQAVNKIRGKSGTYVKLIVKRPGVANTLTFNIKRGNIPLRTVTGKIIKRGGDSIGYIDISQFNENTDKEFKTTLSGLEKQNMDGLIIDVRGNPGGYLQAVEKISDSFIPKEKPIVQVEDRNGKKEAYYSSTTKKKPYPIVDLIDGGSASAAEILTGALKEAGGYPIVGTKSFGKGTVQQGIELSDKSELKLTTYKWLTPDGHWIHKKGIQPTVKVKQPDYFYVTPLALKKGKVLSYDHTGTQIVNLQKMLKGVGFDPGRKDGYFSKETVSAVKAFQKSANLPASGSVDQKTASELQEKVIEQIGNSKNDLQLDKAISIIQEKNK